MADPTLPQLSVDTAMPNVSGYTTVTVPGTYANLQLAIDSVPLGTIISLTAGVEYSANGTLGVLLRNKTTGTGWIIIETAGARASAWLPAAGTRIDGPSKSANMAKIVRPSSSVGGAVYCENSAHHYRLIGVEFRNAGNVEYPNEGWYVVLASESPVLLTDVPHHMVVDRCYIHGTGTAQSVSAKYGVVFGGTDQAVIDTYIDEILTPDGESKGIVGYSSPGPLKIDNNYIAAAGENVFFGGATPFIPSIVPSDITITHNYLLKYPRWRDDPAYYTVAPVGVQVKNNLELKNAQRVLIDGNQLENCWANGQYGYGLLVSPLPGGRDTPDSAYTVVQDVTIQNNVFKTTNAGLYLRAGGPAAYINATAEGPSVRGGRWTIQNNLIVGLGQNGSWTGGDQGRLFLIAQGPFDLKILHNTVVADTAFNDAPFYWTYGPGEFQDNHLQTVDRCVIQSNIFHASTGAFMAFAISGTGDPLASVAPDLNFTYNLAIGPWPTAAGYQTDYPTVFPQDPTNKYQLTSDAGVGYTNLAGGDYSLAPSSPYVAAGLGGTPMGVNWATLQAATVGTVTGVWSGTVPSGNQTGGGTLGGLAMTGQRGLLGFALTPQTP